jgi:hypothetical protein
MPGDNTYAYTTSMAGDNTYTYCECGPQNLARVRAPDSLPLFAVLLTPASLSAATSTAPAQQTFTYNTEMAPADQTFTYTTGLAPQDQTFTYTAGLNPAPCTLHPESYTLNHKPTSTPQALSRRPAASTRTRQTPEGRRSSHITLMPTLA